MEFKEQEKPNRRKATQKRDTEKKQKVMTVNPKKRKLKCQLNKNQVEKTIGHTNVRIIFLVINGRTRLLNPSMITTPGTRCHECREFDNAILLSEY